MISIEYLSHIADTRLRLRADTLEGLFTAGFTALNGLIKPEACGDGSSPLPISKAVSVQSADTTALLVDFLSDVLTAVHEEKAVFCVLRLLSLSATRLEALIEGKPAGGFEEDIKAVTYHEADVRLNAEGLWETLLIFDI
ncbi:MAG: archease [Phaeodactylibacter sp.]|nr:archease [Phaeodactylibacter sp.]MCB9276072.1 archease [Lewinellaceae bacterium]